MSVSRNVADADADDEEDEDEEASVAEPPWGESIESSGADGGDTIEIAPFPAPPAAGKPAPGEDAAAAEEPRSKLPTGAGLPPRNAPRAGEAGAPGGAARV